ncbi:Heterokaryon incompatibility protein (HET) domain containing protein, partial [Hyaloscypha variabilis]
MRLLEIKKGEFSLSEFVGHNIPNYAILSHTWGPDGHEVTFEDIMKGTGKTKAGHRKLQFCARQAEKDQFRYFWVDTCCINKSSSAELSEAINSMFAWYQSSECCYVYLSDVAKNTFEMDFPKSRWFTRGWTLQELIAPNKVNFYDRNWNSLGTKHDLGAEISAIASINRNILYRAGSLQTYSIAERMSWASNRNTTKVEDVAYCLLGIFDIHMPLIYGEREKAFGRLQEEIIRKTSGDSILAWDLSSKFRDAPSIAQSISRNHFTSSLLANSPRCFAHCGGLKR